MFIALLSSVCHLAGPLGQLSLVVGNWSFLLLEAYLSQRILLPWEVEAGVQRIFTNDFEQHQILGSCFWCSEDVGIVLENFQFDPIKGEFPLPLPCVLSGLRYLYLLFVQISIAYTYRNRHIVLHALFYFPLVFMGDHSLLTTSVKENVLPFIPGRRSYFCSDPDADWQLYFAWFFSSQQNFFPRLHTEQ